jgi:TolB-like protein
MSFFEELKRRNVIRVAVVYAVVAWLLIQIVATTFPILRLPDWSLTLTTVLILLGFPLATIFAWAFELTPDGLKIEKAAERGESSVPSIGRKLDVILGALLVIALGYIGYDKFVHDPGRGAAEIEASVSEVGEQAAELAEPQDTRKSIAVLAFENTSDDPGNEYFSDGVSEDILNLLAQIPELRVTSRTSAFSFKGSNATIAEIGRTLNVDHVLEGSVRRSGETVRVTAQLISVSTDTNLWAQPYDRELENIFAIQDEIAESVVDALRVQLLGDIPQVTETTPEAYALYLQSQFLIEQRTVNSFLQAETITKQILEMDPDYAPAWSQLAYLYFFGSAFGAWDSVEVIPLARDAALTSVRLLSINPQARAILVHIAMSDYFDYEQAARELRIALEQSPDNAIVLSAAAEFEQRQGNLEEAIGFYEKAHAIDPLAGHREDAALVYFYSGRHAEGISLFEGAIERTPFANFLHKMLAQALLVTGDVEGALATIQKEPSEGHRSQGLALIYEAMGERERSTEELEKLIAEGSRFTFEITEVHAYRGELDEAFKWMDRAIERHDRALRHVTYRPFLDNMRDDPRFNDVLRRIGLRSEQ